MSEYRTEVTGSSVAVMKRNAAGQYQHIALIPLADIPARADAGEWDRNRFHPGRHELTVCP